MREARLGSCIGMCDHWKTEFISLQLVLKDPSQTSEIMMSFSDKNKSSFTFSLFVRPSLCIILVKISIVPLFTLVKLMKGLIKADVNVGVNIWSGDRLCARLHLHVSSPPSEAQQLLVLAGDEVDGGVLEQGWEHEEQTHGHPDINGFHIGHLQKEGSH